MAGSDYVSITPIQFDEGHLPLNLWTARGGLGTANTFGRLLFVVPLGVAWTVGAVTVTLLWVEAYPTGFQVHFVVRQPAPASRRRSLILEVPLTALDDRGGRYENTDGGLGGFSGVYAGSRQTRFTHTFMPALHPDARRLTLEIPFLRWWPMTGLDDEIAEERAGSHLVLLGKLAPRVIETVPGGWSFPVDLPADRPETPQAPAPRPVRTTVRRGLRRQLRSLKSGLQQTVGGARFLFALLKLFVLYRGRSGSMAILVDDSALPVPNPWQVPDQPRPFPGDLERVLAIGQTIRRAGVEVTWSAIECYTTGFRVNGRLRFAVTQDRADQFSLPVLAQDDRGRTYVAPLGAGGFMGRDVGGMYVRDLAPFFEPALDPEARDLTITLPAIQWWALVDARTGRRLGPLDFVPQARPSLTETVEGPWTVRISIPST